MGLSLAKLIFGCSGWFYQEWVGPFYERASISKLPAYARIFNTSEINTTFYNYPRKNTVLGWLRKSPEDFIFSAKIPGQITHDKKLNVEKGVEEDLCSFLELMDPLAEGGKIGCYLIQLPPRITFNQDKVEAFYALLPTDKYKFAVEFRNKKWLSEKSFNLLEKYNLAYTIVDEPLLPPDVKITANFAYIRWHGRGDKPWYDYHYTEEELKEWVPKVQEVEGSANEVFGYFNNHHHGYAPENCLDILEMLGIATPFQQKTRERIKKYRKKPGITLKDFAKKKTKKTTKKEKEGGKEISEDDTESLLRLFADQGRILRGIVMEKTELKEVKVEEQKITAKIRDYNILIDQEEKIIQHDCADWERRKNSKKICKHIVKLLLTLPEKQSQSILKDLSENLDEWTFE